MTDTTWTCPRCKTVVVNQPQCTSCGFGKGMVYKETDARQMDAAPLQRVVVSDFDMPFASMVAFIMKWTVAAIPAFIMLAIVGAFLAAMLGGFLTALYEIDRF